MVRIAVERRPVTAQSLPRLSERFEDHPEIVPQRSASGGRTHGRVQGAGRLFELAAGEAVERLLVKLLSGV
jgi:hypothetical protein